MWSTEIRRACPAHVRSIAFPFRKKLSAFDLTVYFAYGMRRATLRS